jgi:hypothetical protein
MAHHQYVINVNVNAAPWPSGQGAVLQECLLGEAGVRHGDQAVPEPTDGQRRRERNRESPKLLLLLLLCGCCRGRRCR